MKDSITIAGGDTAQPINTARRVAVVARSAAGFHQPRFLDCGCGAGSYLPHFAALGWQVSGLEFLPDKIAAARAAGLGQDKVVQGDLQALPFASESFDILLFNEVLEHVPSDEAALAEAHRVLKPGGLLVVFSPNRLYPFESHGVLLKQQEQKVKVPVWTPFIPYIPLSVGRRFFHYWARNYWPHELRALVGRSGFTIQEASYVWQTFEGISGDRSGFLRLARPTLRKLSLLLERLPGLRAFGVSQYICARKGVSGR